jgi:ArsR family transcriptional regulator, arsenate/arsenite/antimonite-responsive transcriptional repressor
MALTPDYFFRALSDPTRLRCLVLLATEGELCVCELTHALNEIQPKISRHLASLRESGLVSDRREGLWIHYQLHPDLPAWARETLALVARTQHTAEPYAHDKTRLKSMSDRPSARRCA